MADGATNAPTKNQGTEDKLPVSLDAEQAILGAILFDNEIYYRVSTFLKPEHFFDPVHQLIFEAAGDLINSGGRVLAVTAIGDTLEDALARAYQGVGVIDWPGGIHRRDIGWRVRGK